MEWLSKWIWTAEELSRTNAYVSFRKSFIYTKGRCLFHVTADSRYVLWVNGEYVGQGPVKAWPNHWKFDTYDIEPYLVRGKNTIAVLVNYYGTGTMQYVSAPEGLLAQIELSDQIIPTDSSWRARPCSAYTTHVPRVSIQQAFEEQFDARHDDGWVRCDYDDSGWDTALELRDAADSVHNNYAPRDIPFLTLEPVQPKRIVCKELVQSVPYNFTIDLRPYLAPDDFTSNMIFRHGYLATQIWSTHKHPIRIIQPHGQRYAVTINGCISEDGCGSLRAGWNSLVMQIGTWGALVEYAFCIDGPEGLKFECKRDGGASWALVGPFELQDEVANEAATFMDPNPIIAASLADNHTGQEFWENGDVARIVNEPYFQPLQADLVLWNSNTYAQAYTDKPVEGKVLIQNEENLLSGSGWTTINPDPNGNDIRVLVDFGDELLAFHKFEVVASKGTIIDFHNFEFIQPDGRYNLAEGMNNSFRYICRDGKQSYQTIVHRGFRYSYVILRNMTGPVKLRSLQALFHSYPQTRKGSFICSDAKLGQIWQAGAQSVRCCSEDTYTDCPTYEQTLWVGDARNEALVDWVVNGDPRLWFRCLELTGQSLERFPITQSQVPSSWDNILPAWTFLWMRSCFEYLYFTSDTNGGRLLLDFVKQNIEGIRQHLDHHGLFNIHAWNMFDWAPMDTPAVGVVTHQNCFAVLGLRDASRLAQLLGRNDLSNEWSELADVLADSINVYLWNDGVNAYIDCLRGDVQSEVFSQQTQTLAYMSGVATGERSERCKEIVRRPPDGFVKAGSPFFEFFLLEAYQREGKDQDLLDTIRRDWGFMIDMGATTFWEMWSGREGRLTRSHCHAWSAAPTYFLSTFILGIRPEEPGFSVCAIEPHPADLTWARGTMPTLAGDVEVQWENIAGEPFVMRVKAPESTIIRVRLPRSGVVVVNSTEQYMEVTADIDPKNSRTESLSEVGV
ncbi:MAG: family 78 glycoside hydrolase catalytic domain [Armatimonadota bacterium]